MQLLKYRNWVNSEMRRLGHADIQTTSNTYGQLFSLENSEATIDTLNKIDQMVFNAKN